MCHERECVERAAQAGQCGECEETGDTVTLAGAPHTLPDTHQISAETREKAPGDKEQVLSK